MNVVIGESAVDLVKKRPESNLGNWMADAIHRKAAQYAQEPIDFALQNHGGIRIPIIKKGSITKRKIYELMPFDNKIALLYLNKEEVEQLVEHLLKSRGWPVSYPVRIQQLTEEDIKITLAGKPLMGDKIYTIALPDYIANGGSGSFFLKDKKRKDLNVFIRDILIEDVMDFTKKGAAVEANINGRIIINE